MRRGMWLLLILALGVTACSSERVRLQPIRGKCSSTISRWIGRSWPSILKASNPPHLPKPIAYTNAEGRFKMTTNQPGDGVPAGEYVVTVEWREKSQSGVEKIGGKNLLPPRYAKAESSPLRCTVKAGQDEVAAFKLTD